MSSSSSSDEEQEIEQQRQTKTRTTATTTNPNDNAIILEPLANIAKDKGFEIEQNKDYGEGLIDMVCNILPIDGR